MFEKSNIEFNISSSISNKQVVDFNGSNSFHVLNAEFLTIQFNRDLIGHYFMGITTLSISCIGFLGNILSIGVLTSKYMRGTTTNIYLTALAVSDALMLFFAILVAIRDARRPQYGVAAWHLWKNALFVPRLYPVCHAFALLFQVCSNWLTAAFTIDRYLMICHPFIAKRWFTLRLSQIIIAVLVTASFCYTLPRFFEYEYFSVTPYPNTENSPFQLPTHWYRLSVMGDSTSFRHGYHLWAWCVLVIGIPSLVIAVLNIFLVREINQSIRRMRFEQGVKTRRHETDVMLIGVIVIFFVCQIPSTVSHVMWGIHGYRQNKSEPWIILNEVGNLLVILNASINIVPYYLFGKRFRTLFVMIYFGWMKECRRQSCRSEGQNDPLTPTLAHSPSNGRHRQPSQRTQSSPPGTGRKLSNQFIFKMDERDFH